MIFQENDLFFHDFSTHGFFWGQNSRFSMRAGTLTMIRAWRFAKAAACRVGSIPARCDAGPTLNQHWETYRVF